MKQLLLMRHAKSAWDIPGQSDFERTLNDRGKKDAPEMGRRIRKKEFMPELIVSSTAKRAQKTAREVAAQLGYDEHNIQLESSIYEAEIEDLMHIIRSFDDNTNKVMMVGHNPSFTGIIGLLTNTFIENMPTAGVALIRFDLKSWKQVTKHTGTLEWFDYPKNDE
jgi:phosphohistidine phosphatase